MTAYNSYMAGKPTLNLDVEELRRMYVDELKTLDQIAVLKNTTKRSIANWLIRAGIPRRSYGNRYFTARNREMAEYFRGWKNQSAYIIGYIYADGSIDVLNPRSRGVCLQCRIMDREIIDGIANELKLTELVKIRTLKPTIVLGKYEYGEKQNVSLRFYNNELVDLLAEYGVHPRKTWINYPLPDVPQESMRHFLRGVFDGDGWTSFKKGRVDGVGDRISFGFLGPELFLEQMRDFLASKVLLPFVKIVKRPGCFSLAWSTSAAAKLLYDFLYPNGSYIFLRRKMDMLLEISKSQKGIGGNSGKFKNGHPHYPRKKNGSS